MSLQKEIQALMDSIRLPILFYLPEELADNTSDETKQQLTDIGFIQQLFFLSKDNEAAIYKEGIHDLAIAEKQKLLKYNIIQLMEMQSRLSEKSFQIMIDNYYQEVRAWQWSSEWMSKNAKDNLIGYANVMQSSLEMQSTILKEHQLELESTFEKFKNPKNKQNALRTNALNTYQEKVSQIEIDNLKTKNKKVLLTDVEADVYLLEKVFNVVV